MARTRLNTLAEIDSALPLSALRADARTMFQRGTHVQHVMDLVEQKLKDANADASHKALVDWAMRELRAVEATEKRQTHAEDRTGKRRKLPKYTSSGGTLDPSRRMVSKGPNQEVRAVIHDLEFTIKNLKSQLRYYDHGTGEQVAKKIEKLRQELLKWLEFVPPEHAARVLDNLYR